MYHQMKKKFLYIDFNNLYGWAMSEYLPYDEIKFDRNVGLEEIEVDLKYPDNKKYERKFFKLRLKKRHSPANFIHYMKKIITDTYALNEKLICDWSDKKII